jgi:hypothetical protein
MRFVTAIPTCLALLQAFVVAPFQHVHPGGDHDHPAIIHAHFYHLAMPDRQHPGRWLEDADDDDHDAVWSVDSFTLVPGVPLVLSAPVRAAVELFEPPIPVAWVDVVEQCGHDPPCVSTRIPRAPPS